MNGRYPSTSKRLTASLLAGTLIGLSLLRPASAETPPPEPSNPSDVLAAPGDLHNLLSALLTSQDRIALAGKLEAALRAGDLTNAERNLDTAIDVGTFAAILTEYLRNPSLLPALQKHGISSSAASPSSNEPGQAAAPAACRANEAQTAELRQALQQEQVYSSMIAKTLTDLMQEHNELKVRLDTETSSKAKIQLALQKEQEQLEAAARELANLQNDYRTLRETREQATPVAPSPAADTAELKALLQQEREKNEEVASQLAAMAQELSALETLKREAAEASARVAEIETMLMRERMSNETLIRELADTTDELRALRDPFQASATPLLFRIVEKGADIPLPQPDAIAQALPLATLPQSEPALPDDTSAIPAIEPAPVVIAALPSATQPLLIAPKPAEPVQSPLETGDRSNPATRTSGTDDRLVDRADELLRRGDVSGARLLLERSLTSGNARAVFLMAETFDPNVLAELRVIGMRGDAAKAQELYARARDLGVARAGERLEALK